MPRRRASRSGVLGAQLGDLGALATGLLIGGDPAECGSDVEVEHEREDADQRPAAEPVPTDPMGTAVHTCRVRSTRQAPFLCNGYLRSGTLTAPGTRRRRRAPPRCAAAGCTWP